ncbi:MAG: type II secretion system protein [Gallionellaceae bacterium]
MSTLYKNQRGFTLVEMIIVMVITGIIGAMVAVFIKAPVQGYVDSARRAELTDIADTALRRISRDVRGAVPNSVQATSSQVEFLPTKDGGRYRADSGGTNNVLTFGVADGSFEIVGSAINFADGAGASPDYIVVGSTQSDAVPAYDTSSAGVLRQYTGAAGPQTIVNFTNTALPTWAELPSQRFDVVDGAQRAVFYKCETLGTDSSGNGTGKLMRYWNYGFTHTTGATSAILADKVSACTIDYGVVNQRYSLLTIKLTITSSNESVTLYNEIHVNNSP